MSAPANVDLDEDDVLADLGRRVQELREARGLTQDALAEQLSITPQYLRAIEAGGVNLKTRWLVRFANALGCVGVGELFEPPQSRESRGPGRPRRKRAPETDGSV